MAGTEMRGEMVGQNQNRASQQATVPFKGGPHRFRLGDEPVTKVCRSRRMGRLGTGYAHIT